MVISEIRRLVLIRLYSLVISIFITVVESCKMESFAQPELHEQFIIIEAWQKLHRSQSK